MDLALNNLQRLICHKNQPKLYIHDLKFLLVFIKFYVKIFRLLIIPNVYLVFNILNHERNPHGVVDKELECSLKVSKFKLQ